MGVVYSVSCDRCGTNFEHQAGLGLIFSCVGCGESSDEHSAFYCPVCNKRYDPQSDDFGDTLTSVVNWD